MKIKLFFWNLIMILLYLCPTATSQVWEPRAVGLLPENYGVFSISIVDENVVWAVAFDQSIFNASLVPPIHKIKVLKTLNGGLSWICYDMNEAMGRIGMDIYAFDSLNAFVTTNDLGNGTGKGLFKTENGGLSWVEKFHDESAGSWVHFFDPQSGIVVNHTSVATTQDGGDSWLLLPSDSIPCLHATEFTELISGKSSFQVIGNNVWFGTSQGRIFLSTNRGQKWEAVTTSLGSNANIVSVTFRDTLNGLAMRYANPVEICKTDDGGKSWTNVSMNNNLELTCLRFVPGTSQTLIGNHVYTAVSLDFGLNWQIVDIDEAFRGLYFTEPGNGWTARFKVTDMTQGTLYKWIGGNISREEIGEGTVENDVVFPNPTSGLFYFKAENDRYSCGKLYNASGKPVYSFSFHDNEIAADITGMQRGWYLLEIISIHGERKTFKLLKQ